MDIYYCNNAIFHYSLTDNGNLNILLQTHYCTFTGNSNILLQTHYCTFTQNIIAIMQYFTNLELYFKKQWKKQNHKREVVTIMKNQFYTHFEIKILYIKPGIANKLYS